MLLRLGVVRRVGVSLALTGRQAIAAVEPARQIDQLAALRAEWRSCARLEPGAADDAAAQGARRTRGASRLGGLRMSLLGSVTSTMTGHAGSVAASRLAGSTTV